MFSKVSRIRLGSQRECSWLRRWPERSRRIPSSAAGNSTSRRARTAQAPRPRAGRPSTRWREGVKGFRENRAGIRA